MAISPVTPEMQSKLAIWRQKAADGSISIEEMRQAVRELRAGRQAAIQTASAAKRSSAKTPTRSAEDLLGELGI